MSTRLVGSLIVVKVILPFVIVGIALSGSLVVVFRLTTLVNDQWQSIAGQTQRINTRLAIVTAESLRVIDEARKLKDESFKFAEEVKALVKPLKAALHGLSQGIGVLARTVQNVINGVVSAINAVPFVNIPKVRIANFFKVPAFDITLPNVDLNVSGKAYEAVRELSELSYQMAEEIRVNLERLWAIIMFWLGLLAVLLVLLLLWALLAVVGYTARCRRRLDTGWRMIRGEAVEGALTLL